MRISFPRRTARLRLTALYGGVFLVSGVVLVAATYFLFQRLTVFNTPALPKVPHTPTIHKSQLPHVLFGLSKVQIRLANDQHQLKLLPSSPGSGPRRIAFRSPLFAQAEHRLSQDQHRLARAVHQLRQAVHQVAQAGTVQAAQRASDSHELLVDSGIALGGVGILALLAGWLVAGRMLRPIRTITRAARRISSTSLHERLALEGPEDELKELGDTLDDLLARLEAAFEAQRRFVAHASHELRTPLTRERALVQVALDDPSRAEWESTGQQLLATNREQETLIDALLTLASSESGLDHREPVNLAEITATVLRDRNGNTNPTLHFDSALDAAFINGDPRLLERLVANLVDNAIRHNVEGGRVHVWTGSKDGNAALTVTNTGPLIPASEIDRLFQPFQRLDPDRIHRHGHGLGLSIVRAIATAHGANISAHPSPEGGLSIEVDFRPSTYLERDAEVASYDHRRSPRPPSPFRKWRRRTATVRPRTASTRRLTRRASTRLPDRG